MDIAQVEIVGSFISVEDPYAQGATIIDIETVLNKQYAVNFKYYVFQGSITCTLLDKNASPANLLSAKTNNQLLNELAYNYSGNRPVNFK